jgi:hypothetical protein
MTRFLVSFTRAAQLIESRFPLRCSDPATSDSVDVYPDREYDYHEEFDEDTTTTSGHPDDGWYTYDINRYHVPDPDGQEIGCIELISDRSSYEVTLSLRRTKPFNRAYNGYWMCVSTFFEEVKQLLAQEEAARRQAAAPKTQPALQPPLLREPTAAATPDQRREFQVMFYGTPAEFGSVVAVFAQRQAHQYGGHLFQLRSPITPDTALVQVWVHDLVVARGCVGSIVAQRLPGGHARLFVLTDEAHLPALLTVWELLRTELEQQGRIDPGVTESQTERASNAPLLSQDQTSAVAERQIERVADTPPASQDQMSDAAELSRHKNRNSGKYARDYEGRRQAVEKYREAHRKGQIRPNKETWVSNQFAVTERAFRNWEKEFPEEP